MFSLHSISDSLGWLKAVSQCTASNDQYKWRCINIVHCEYVTRQHTFLEGGEQCELFDEADLDEGSIWYGGRNEGGNHK